MHRIFKGIAILALITFYNTVEAQQIGISPYSQTGIGDFSNEGYSRNVAMGGAGLASSHHFYINQLNPASNITHSTVIYEFGLIGQVKTLKTSLASDYSTAANLNYIGMMFPIKSKTIQGKKTNLWGMGLGLKPFSEVSYANSYLVKIVGDTAHSIFQTKKGNGGLNQVYMSHGVRLSKKIAIGLTTAYVFGPIVKENNSWLDNRNIAVVQKNNLSSLQLKPSVTYKKLLGKEDSLETNSKTFFSVAGTVDMFSNTASSSVSEVRRINTNTVIIKTDTLNQLNNFSSTLPFAYHLGFAFDHFGNDQAQKWSLATDFSFADWSKYETFGTNAGLNQYYAIKIGGEYTPTYVSTKSYFNRMTYRAGLYFIHTPVTYANNDIIDLGATLGFAFSIPKTLTNFNLGFAAGQKGTTANGAVQEQYLKIHLGISINDFWFFKRQLD